MNSEELEKFTDRWLDSALKQFSAVEPPPELESRLLSPARSRRLRPVHFAWPAVAAILLGAMILGTSKDHTATQPELRPGSSTRQLNNNLLVAHSRPLHVPSEHPACRKASTPPALRKSSWRNQFPSPAPLSEEEKLLLVYIRSTPKEELLAVAAQQEQENAQNFDSTPNFASGGEIQ